MKKIYVLIACEESQVECQAFRDLGHIAYSCDLQPCPKRCHPEWLICGDVIPYLHGQTHFVTQDGFQRNVTRWDVIVSHPPCTYLCNLPPLMSEIINPNATSLLASRRGKYRSRTDKCMAQALTQQWSEFILNNELLKI